MNKSLFKSSVVEVKNEAGGVAFKLSDKESLAQYALTGCLNGTIYADAKTQLDKIIQLCHNVEPEYVAKLAVYAREKGNMKDVPALLVAYLVKNNDLLRSVFHRVIDNAKMLRNFVEVIRSGVVGRVSFGSNPRRLIHDWFNSRTAKEIFMQSTGDKPSLADVLRLAHPRPLDPQKNALYQWLLGRQYNPSDLPSIVQEYELFRSKQTTIFPTAPSEMLMGLNLTLPEWCQLASRAGWHWLRMNLNTLERKGVWGVEGMADIVAEKLRDRDSITRTRIYPYQIMTTFKNVGPNTPPVVRSALEEAMEVALENVPTLPGAGYVLIDISGSMKSPLTGNKPGATSKVNCCDVASLMTSSIIRKNPLAKVIGFNGHAHPLELKTCAKVMENAQFLINKVSGGTACHEPLRLLNDTKATGDWLVMISDNQSHSSLQTNDLRETEGAAHWRVYKLRNPEAKMACVDIQPYATTQIKSGKDVLNVGGWSDAIFDVLNSFFSGHIDSPNMWVKEIESISL